MIFYLIYYLFLILTLISTPYLTGYYILAGDPYLLVTSGPYFTVVLFGTIFLLSYLFNTTNYLYYCFVNRRSDIEGVSGFLKAIHGVTLATFWTSLYMAIGGIIAYIVGIRLMEGVGEIKDALMAVIHLPGFEFVLKGIPIAFGSLTGNIFASMCVNPVCT